MRRRRRSYRTKPPKPPKPPKPVKMARPKGNDLRIMYKGLVTTDNSQMVASLSYAMSWYDNALPYVLYKTGGNMTEQQTKWYEIALKVRNIGVSTTYIGEKITMFQKALEMYQKVLLSVDVKVPDIAKYLTVQQAKKAGMEELEKRLMAKYSVMLNILTQALQPITGDGRPVTLKIGTVKDPLIIDPEEASITFRRDSAREMYKLMRRQGLLNLVIEVVDPLSKIAALELEKGLDGNPTGRRMLNRSKQKDADHRLWKNFAAWAATDGAPKRLVRKPTVLVPGQVAPSADGKPRVARVGIPGKREYIEAGYIVGSSGAQVLILMKDYKWHEMSEIAAVAATGQGNPEIEYRLKSLTKRGLKYGLWTVIRNGSQYRIEPIQPAPAQGGVNV